MACSAGYDAPGCSAALPINIKEAYREGGSTKGSGSAFKPEAVSEFTLIQFVMQINMLIAGSRHRGSGRGSYSPPKTEKLVRVAH